MSYLHKNIFRKLTFRYCPSLIQCKYKWKMKVSNSFVNSSHKAKKVYCIETFSIEISRNNIYEKMYTYYLKLCYILNLFKISPWQCTPKITEKISTNTLNALCLW